MEEYVHGKKRAEGDELKKHEGVSQRNRKKVKDTRKRLSMKIEKI